ncbi:MAG: M56 family metallopeptidase [Chloroflexi bacterium]|nr:M56 family metallopeptidase [Chloroflexota bacterium]
MRDRRYPVLVSLLGLAVICTAIAGLRWLWPLNAPGDPAPAWAICCQMLGMTMTADVTQLMAALLRSVLFTFALFGLGSLGVRLWKTQRFVDKLRCATVTRPPRRLRWIARQLGLARQVIVIAAPQPLAFCFGFVRPRICLSVGLAEALTDAELRAVLLHEDHHRRHFDPLRGLIVEVSAATLVFLPIADELRDWAMTHAELAADRHAIFHAGRASLAGALHKILTHPLAVRLPVAVGVSGLSATEARIAHLTGDRRVDLRPSALSLLSSSAILIAACMIVQIPTI